VALHRFPAAKALLRQARPVFARHLMKERVMSLVTYDKPKAPAGVPAKSATPAGYGAASIIASRVRGFLAIAGRWLANAFDAIAEARMHKAMIEAQMYLNRCKHSSKNDDDLPVLR
jgi:hypothetical protein